jgi:hypothetical protein
MKKIFRILLPFVFALGIAALVFTPDTLRFVTQWISSAVHAKPQAKTLKQFLQIAMQPVGETMYVWGGGWNEADNAAGPEGMTIGRSPRWKAFFNEQTSVYSTRDTAYMIHDGLDCTGFLGWALYNIFPNDTGHVTWASNAARMLTQNGWGSAAARGTIRSSVQAGDIMCNDDHVWISLGLCADGSAVILHASPPGVMINGTQSVAAKSAAIALAEHYMRSYFAEWYAKYPNCARGESYLTDFDRFRWSAEVLPDPDGYRRMSAASVLEDLFAP